MSNILKNIPSVDKITLYPPVKEVIKKYSRDRILFIIRALVDSYRETLKAGASSAPSLDDIYKDIIMKIEKEESPSLKRVINASGTIIHSNLGRSPLPEEVLAAVKEASSGAVNLEYDLTEGKRGDRDSHLEALICRLTGAEAATVVNNNAAALLIVLNTISKKKEVIISRGELVEIGGSFRIPDIIKSSWCKMKEVGTTNRTSEDDYINAICDKTGVLLKVHTSNYRIVGFTKSVGLDDLVRIGKEHKIPVVEDLGSGAITDLSIYKLKKEPLVIDRIRTGVDIVTFSGDKLLGGPQAGIIAGKKELIKKINKNPLKRALRVDKMTISALEALFKIYLDPDSLPARIPFFKNISRSIEEIESIANKSSQLIREHFGDSISIYVKDDFCVIGSGSLPCETIPTKSLHIRHKKYSALKISQIFRSGLVPIIGRIKKDHFILDMRCIEKPEDVVPL